MTKSNHDTYTTITPFHFTGKEKEVCCHGAGTLHYFMSWVKNMVQVPGKNQQNDIQISFLFFVIP